MATISEKSPQNKTSVYETPRLRHHAPSGKSFGIRPASCRRVAGSLEDDQGVPHPKLFNLSAQTRRWPALSVQLFEYTGSDFGADMAKLAADPATQKWWAVCKPCQEPLGDRAPDEWWANMDEVFHLD